MRLHYTILFYSHNISQFSSHPKDENAILTFPSSLGWKAASAIFFKLAFSSKYWIEKNANAILKFLSFLGWKEMLFFVKLIFHFLFFSNKMPHFPTLDEVGKYTIKHKCCLQ